MGSVELSIELRNLLSQRAGNSWLITGGAGFIGSHLLEQLLLNAQRVTVLDDFSTGTLNNLEQVRAAVGPDLWRNFNLVCGSVEDAKTCEEAVSGTNIVLHHAGLSSVSQSLNDPSRFTQSNLMGYQTLLEACRAAGVKRIVSASSSSVYGNSTQLPLSEEARRSPVSPYGATKAMNELQNEVYWAAYGLETVSLRYFNVFGPRQNPSGSYSAVIPRWIHASFNDQPIVIYGDGQTTRDFCYIGDVTEACIRTALSENREIFGNHFNIASGQPTSLLELFEQIEEVVAESESGATTLSLRYEEFRSGDIARSHADLSRTKKFLGYEPRFSLTEGLRRTVAYFQIEDETSKKPQGSFSPLYEA